MTSTLLLFLCALLLMQGGKTPLHFGLCAIPALLWSAKLVLTNPLEIRKVHFFFGALAGLSLCWAYSLDPHQSLFWSAQLMVYGSLGLASTCDPSRPSEDFFWRILIFLSLFSAGLTTYQRWNHLPQVGFLPINPTFNAIWMTAIAIALLSKRVIRHHEWGIILWLSALVILGSSRSALLALAGGAVYAAALRLSLRKVCMSVLALLLAAFLLPNDWLINRFVVHEEGARLRIWATAWKAFLDYPLTGYGPGNFELAYLKHAFPVMEAVRYGRETAFAHNDWLQALSEWGWPVFGFLMIGLISVLRARTSSPLVRPVRGILLVLSIGSIFNTLFRLPLLAVLGLMAFSELSSPPWRTAAMRSASLGMRFLAAGLMIALAGLMGWCAARDAWARQGNWDAILRLNPHDAEALHEKAYRANSMKERLRLQEQAVRKSPFHPFYAEALARTLESIPGRVFLTEAQAAYLRAIELSPGRATNYLGMARLLWRSGHVHEAARWVEEARVLEPHYWEAELWLARSWHATGKTRQARLHLEQLQARYRRFRQSATPPRSAYEDTILAYDPQVVEAELASWRDSSSKQVQ